MAVNEVKLNPEQKSLMQSEQFSREEDFAKKLVQSFDLPSNLSNAIEDKITEEKREPSRDEEEEDAASEVESEDSAETETEPEEDSEKVEDSEEDLIPKSKVQSRIDELTREKRQLESEVRKLREAQQEKSVKSDPDIEKLEAMNDDQLRTLKKQVKIEQMNAVQTQNRDRLNELLELEDKIERVSKEAPSKFQSRQISNFNSAVSDTASDPEIRDFKKAGPEIFKKAQAIFSNSPELQSSPTGQARAWNLAVDQYKEISKLTEGKSKTVELERTVNNLKKKVSVDSGVQKGNEKAADERKVFNRAKNGTEDDKLNFFKKSVISPEMYKRQD